jgi:hypothetical protein
MRIRTLEAMEIDGSEKMIVKRGEIFRRDQWGVSETFKVLCAKGIASSWIVRVDEWWPSCSLLIPCSFFLRPSILRAN